MIKIRSKGLYSVASVSSFNQVSNFKIGRRNDLIMKTAWLLVQPVNKLCCLQQQYLGKYIIAADKRFNYSKCIYLAQELIHNNKV